VSGSLFSISLFEEKLMKNFQLISNKLRKFEALMELEQRNKTLEKEFKFLSMKVDTILEKLPKEGFSLNRNDVRLISKDQFF
jgi:ribosomal protein L9